MGPLLGDMIRKMQHKVEHGDKDPLKILVHSTHDTAIAGLCSTLDVFDEKYAVYLSLSSLVLIRFLPPDRWPAFTAAITFELIKKLDDSASQNKSPNYPQSFLSFLGKTSPAQHCSYLLISSSFSLRLFTTETNHHQTFECDTSTKTSSCPSALAQADT